MIDAINVAVLLIAGLALADVVWHDLMRKGLIWPSFPNRSRHQICVWVYMALASAFGIRAFIAAGDPVASLQVGAYYVLLAAGITMEAIALSKEERSQCQPTSDSA